MTTPRTLEPLADGIWTVEQGNSVVGMPIGHRMTVVRLASGGLWLHSPVPHAPELVRALEAEGRIEHWVAPSRVHDLWLEGWFERQPEASSWGAPLLRGPHPDWNFTGWLAEDLDAPWREEFDLVEIAGAPRIGEWMFLHRPSRTAITADVLFNLGTEARGFGRLMLRLAGTYGHAGRSRLFKTMIRDSRAFEASLARVLEWEFDTLVVGHGAPLTDDPKALLAAAWGL